MICLLSKILNFDTCYLDKANKIEKKKQRKKRNETILQPCEKKKRKLKLKENVYNISYV